MRGSLFIPAILLVCTARAETPTSSVDVKSPHDKALAIYAPAPAYPIEARARHFTGSGIVLLQVDPKTGYVIGAQMLKSTGHVMLDNASMVLTSRLRLEM